jgi:TPR repeat protein
LVQKLKKILRDPIKNMDDPYRSGNFVKAFRMAKSFANQGEPAAQLLLGMMYYFGQGVDRNPAEAAKWTELCVEKLKLPLIQQIVGNNYLLGDGVEKDIDKGISWLRLSADQGFAPAQFDLGKALQDGVYGTKNSTEAAQLYELADQQPIKNWNGLSAIDAMKNTNFVVPVSAIIDLKTRLGLMYYEGNGVMEDPHKATIYFQEAVELGGGFSSIMLAAMYEDGLGVERNYFKAFELYKIAIDREMPFAMSRLATLFEKGLGVEKDLREALNLYKLSADQDDPDGIAGFERVRLLLGEISDEEL